MERATQDLLHQEQLFQQQLQQHQQQQHPVNVAFRASLKRPPNNDKIKMQLDEEAHVRKEFTYEYVMTEPSQDGGPVVVEELPKVSWPRPSLMREKSSAVADLRARSESPSANRVLVLRDAQLAAKASARPKPPPKPSLHDLQQALLLKRTNGLAHMMMMEEQQQQQTTTDQQRLSFAESLPESLAGFAATIVSEDGGSPCPFEPTVSPLISECDWHTTGNGSSPAPLPDLMSLASVTSGQLRSSSMHAASENLYMNANPLAEEADQSANGSIIEDHYLPMTSTKLMPSSRSPPPLPAANNTSYQFEENAYVEMTDNGKIKTSPPGRKPNSVFAGIFDPSYRSPESPRYTEISDCPSAAADAPQKQEEEDQPHYEFIYKASSQIEPVYMEVPQSEEEEKPEADVGELETSHHQEMSSMDTSAALLEEMDDGNRPLELIIAPPRHPRFSISDTFRPASYFLRLETIPAEENGDHGQSDDDNEMTSPVPTTSPPAVVAAATSCSSLTSGGVAAAAVPDQQRVHHSRSQSLDTSQDFYYGGRCMSRNSVTSELSHSARSDLSRRRPLTIVRSLEDLLVDDDQMASQEETATSALFQGSTQSLASSSRNAETWQPLYENVTQTPQTGHVRQASRISIASSATSRRTSPAGSIHSDRQQLQQQQRPRLGSALSINSNVSASSMTRSEQSAGAPYYYSDLLSKAQSTTPEVTQDDGISLRSSSSRSAQAQAAKQAYQHSMDRLRSVQRRSSPPESSGRMGSTTTLDSQHQQQTSSVIHSTPPTGQFRSEPRQLLETIRKQQQQQLQRAQTPDLLANHPEPLESSSFYYAAASTNGATPTTSRPMVGEVMRRVRSLEGLLDDETNNRSMQQQQQPDHRSSTSSSHANGSNNGETPRYARDPTRGSSTKTLPSHIRSPQGSDFVGGEFSPWDEDQLWRDKLRRASIRHTRSMDMLDDIHQEQHQQQQPHTNGNGVNKSVVAAPEEDCYERLLQYSATLERTKRGQTYLDGYLWDEMEQRFRKPGAPPPPTPSSGKETPVNNNQQQQQLNNNTNNSPSHPFLEDGLPPPAFEIDREKLRQWDLMSTAPVPSSDNRVNNISNNKEGGRRPAAAENSSSNNNRPSSDAATSNSKSPRPFTEQRIHQQQQHQQQHLPPPLPLSSPPVPSVRPSQFQPVPPDLVRTPGKILRNVHSPPIYSSRA